jgi:hypothetical protein
MKVELNYWDKVDYYSSRSEIKRTEYIESDNEIDVFESFYKKNNSLRYCNGSYFKFVSSEWDQKYKDWLNSDDYKKKSFNLFYGNGVVD